jgi:hypothetical protein
MKYLSYTFFCAILLCCPAMHSQPALTLNNNQVKFLVGCGVRQDDIQAIPNLTSDGQLKILAILHNRNRGCGDLKPFKDSRDYMRKYTPPPSMSIVPPNGYDIDFLTKAESDYLGKIDSAILAQLLKDFGVK